MIFKIVSLFIIALIQYSICCETFPNGTDTKLNWFNCPDSKLVIFNSVVTVDGNNNKEYPIKLKEPVYVNVNIDNNGNTFSSIRLDLELYQWGGWQGCSWHQIPTFGLLSNLDACKHGVPCPIASGKNQNLKVTIDFTKFESIISLLKNDAPYQLMFKLTDIPTGETSCTMVQARSFTNE
ncbi:MD-2-related lipid-recognition domain and Immunoglobulin E-set domain-containing protein [Strongyloides ratti]|uniref:MD-2-related lipid-recognition domain and Immunoglobulin E-set domain-containing protein n=1 Tax=Strongyloides ratti TaxID=34506 RepID=A0A090LK87_STRRB|nr:MD-2-related lipid-recognition domain and Immunoglobulin E-set domain-containing protein [Strongyloides ratti]CEF70182.1 MD-2-related lipid-recognition domain and Immunoglobulin E-set domain-containing protein [Strongyloides ratti]